METVNSTKAGLKACQLSFNAKNCAFLMNHVNTNDTRHVAETTESMVLGQASQILVNVTLYTALSQPITRYTPIQTQCTKMSGKWRCTQMGSTCHV